MRGIIKIQQSAMAGEWWGGGNQVNSIVTQPQSSYFPLPSPASFNHEVSGTQALFVSTPQCLYEQIM